MGISPAKSAASKPLSITLNFSAVEGYLPEKSCDNLLPTEIIVSARVITAFSYRLSAKRAGKVGKNSL
jgi:hypothetical protein